MDNNTGSMAPPSEVRVPLPRRRGQRISPQVWNEQRPRFQKLYEGLEMSLPETMKAMEDTYGFYASEKQYKTKIKQWKLTKYVNEDKMEYMLRKEKRRRTQEGKNTIFTHNYREVEHEKLDRFRKRRKLQDDDIGSSIISKPSRVEYFTPPGQSPYATLAGRSPERAGSETGSSLAPSTITSGSRSTSTSGSVLLRLKWNGLDMRALRDMEWHARTLLMDNPTKALEVFRQVLAGYEHLFGPDEDNALELLPRMAEACSRLNNVIELEALSVRAISGYERIYGPDDRKTLICLARIADVYTYQGRFEDSEVLYVRAIKGLDDTLPFSVELLEIFTALASVYWFQGFYEKAHNLYKLAVDGYRDLGPGYEEELLDAKLKLSSASEMVRDSNTDNLYVEVLAECEARNQKDYVFSMLALICERSFLREEPERFDLYNQKLRLITSEIFGKGKPISDDLHYRGMMLADFYSRMGRYVEADSLFIRLKDKTDEVTRSQLTGRGNFRDIRKLFQSVGSHAEHYIRQCKWKDAEPLLLKAKSLETPFFLRMDSQRLVEALERFRIGSGREAGALPLAQRTPGTEMQSPQRIPGQAIEGVGTVISVGSADFQQPLDEIDWANFPLPSPSAFSIPWSPQQPAPPGATQPGSVTDLVNDDMMGMYGSIE